MEAPTCPTVIVSLQTTQALKFLLLSCSKLSRNVASKIHSRKHGTEKGGSKRLPQHPKISTDPWRASGQNKYDQDSTFSLSDHSSINRLPGVWKARAASGPTGGARSPSASGHCAGVGQPHPPAWSGPAGNEALAAAQLCVAGTCARPAQVGAAGPRCPASSRSARLTGSTGGGPGRGGTGRRGGGPEALGPTCNSWAPKWLLQPLSQAI